MCFANGEINNTETSHLLNHLSERIGSGIVSLKFRINFKDNDTSLHPKDFVLSISKIEDDYALIVGNWQNIKIKWEWRFR
jgi:hypothetical protein